MLISVLQKRKSATHLRLCLCLWQFPAQTRERARAQAHVSSAFLSGVTRLATADPRLLKPAGTFKIPRMLLQSQEANRDSQRHEHSLLDRPDQGVGKPASGWEVVRGLLAVSQSPLASSLGRGPVRPSLPDSPTGLPFRAPFSELKTALSPGGLAPLDHLLYTGVSRPVVSGRTSAHLTRGRFSLDQRYS